MLIPSFLPQSRKEGSRFRTLMAAQLLLEKSSASDTAPREKEIERKEAESTNEHIRGDLKVST
jgi:hypothetical protein